MRARAATAVIPSARAAPAVAPRARLRDDFRTYARAAILAAAEEVFATDGLHQARIEKIAERARVAVGSIYNLVGDRDALVTEIVGARQAEVLALMKSTLKEQGKLPFEQQLHAFLVALFSYMREHRHFFRLVVEADRAGAQRPLRARGRTLSGIRKAYGALVASGIRQRALKPAGRDLYPVLLMGMVREVFFTDVETGTAVSPQQRATQLVEIFLQGAGTR